MAAQVGGYYVPNFRYEVVKPDAEAVIGIPQEEVVITCDTNKDLQDLYVVLKANLPRYCSAQRVGPHDIKDPSSKSVKYILHNNKPIQKMTIVLDKLLQSRESGHFSHDYSESEEE